MGRKVPVSLKELIGRRSDAVALFRKKEKGKGFFILPFCRKRDSLRLADKTNHKRGEVTGTKKEKRVHVPTLGEGGQAVLPFTVWKKKGRTLSRRDREERGDGKAHYVDKENPHPFLHSWQKGS